MAWMIVRVRGGLHARTEIVDTMRLLHLTRPNHATVVPEAPEVRGMITKIQGYVTWGEVDEETLGLLLRARGRPRDGERGAGPGASTPPADRSASAEELSALAKKVAERGLSRVDELRPLFRLKAPKGGWRSTKKSFKQGGALGYRGPAINDLARRMV